MRRDVENFTLSHAPKRRCWIGIIGVSTAHR